MKIYRSLTNNLTLTKLCNVFTNIFMVKRVIKVMGLA